MEKTNTPVVTILIPVLNRTLYLEDTLRSVVNQSYQNLEIIISDNGSSVNVKEFLTPFLNADKRIVFRRNEATIPMPVHFNQCLNIARGKYFIIVSDDDTVSDKFIELFVNRFEANPGISIGVSANIIIDDKSKPIYTMPVLDWEIKKGADFLTYWIRDQKQLPVATFVSLFTVTDILKKAGGFPEFQSGGYSDTAAAINLCYTGDILFEKEAVFFYRIYNGSFGLSMPYTSLAKSSKQFIAYYKKRKFAKEEESFLSKRELIAWVRYTTISTFSDRLNKIYKQKRIQKLKSFIHYGVGFFELNFLAKNYFNKKGN